MHSLVFFVPNDTTRIDVREGRKEGRRIGDGITCVRACSCALACGAVAET